MPLPVLTQIASGFDDASGSAYWRTTRQLLIVDSGAGTISALNTDAKATPIADSGAGTISALNTDTKATPTVLGSGFTAPHDIALSADGVTAYIADAPGTLYKVSLSNPSQNAPTTTVIASKLNGICQIALDEAHGFAYVAEFTAGQLQQINLTPDASGNYGIKVVATVFSPRGLLLTTDGSKAYVSSDAGTITCFNLATNTNSVIASGLNGPRYLTWLDAGHSVILFTQDGPVGTDVTGTVFKLDLAASPAVVTPIAGPTPFGPYSVAVIHTPNQIVIVSAGHQRGRLGPSRGIHWRNNSIAPGWP